MLQPASASHTKLHYKPPFFTSLLFSSLLFSSRTYTIPKKINHFHYYSLRGMKIYPIGKKNPRIGPNICGFCRYSSISDTNGFRSTIITTISVLLLLSTTTIITPVTAQPNTGSSGLPPPPGSSSDEQDPYNNKFSPSMGVIIIILISALFFMGFFSIYIRHCADDSSSSTANLVPGATARSRRQMRGLEPSVIQTFPVFDYAAVKSSHIGKGGDELECAICLNEFEDDETLRLIPKCDHVFHPECIDAWLVAHTTCPVCRANLVPQPGDSVHDALRPDQLLLGQICEHNQADHQVVVDVHPPPGTGIINQDGSHHTGASGNNNNNNVSDEDDESMERPLHAPRPPPQSPEMADFNARRLNRNRTTRRNMSGSGRPRWFDRFSRSNSTGHLAVKQWENLERFRLRVPDDVRKQIMSGKLSRSSSLAAANGIPLPPTQGSSRRGFRQAGFGNGGGGEGSSRGKYSGRLDRFVSKSDHWIFSIAPPFLTRMSSLRSPRGTTAAPSRNGSVHNSKTTGDSVHAQKGDSAIAVTKMASDQLPV